MRFLIALATALAIAVPAAAQTTYTPPSKMPPFTPNGYVQGVVIYDANGNVVSGFGGGSGGGGSSVVTGSQEQDVRASAPLNSATANAAITLALNGQGSVGFTFTGLTASGATLTYEQSNDGGTTWTGVNEINAGTGVPSGTRTTDGQTPISVSGRTGLRVRVSTVGTGTITVATNVSVREAIMSLGSPLPPGANLIGYTLAGQYNSTLPTLASGQPAYIALDSNGRQILSPTITLPVGLADGADVAEGAKADAAATNGTGSWSVISLLKGIYNGLLAPTPAGTNTIGKVGIDQTTPGTTNGVQINNQATQTTAGAIAPPTAASGKITRTSTALTASTSTTVAAANTNRIALAIQCGSGGVSVDETGGALTAAGVGNGTLFIPANPGAYFTPPVATLTAVTAYTATAQTCVVTEYLR